MIGSNLVVEGVPGNHHHHHHHHALAGAGSHPLHSFSAIHHLNPSTSRNHLMSATAYSNGPLLPPPEFAHPLPKTAPLAARYNAVTSSLNGNIKSRLPGKYSDSESQVPVNLVQPKDTLPSDAHSGYGMYPSPRLYTPSPSYPHFQPPPASIQTGPYGPLFPPHPFTPILHRDNRSTHLLPLQQYPDSNTPILKSPPSSVANTVKTIYEPPVVPIVTSETSHRGEKRPFKVPSGKEGSLKHRILTRPGSEMKVQKKIARNVNALFPPPTSVQSNPSEKNERATSPTDLVEAAVINNANNNNNNHNNSNSGNSSSTNSISSSNNINNDVVDHVNNPILPKFIKGSLIKLANGSLKKVEDMRTEDFLSCVENSTTVRLDPSTVVRIKESALKKGMTIVTLSYGEQRTEVDFESSVEHPYFVAERGWSSYSPNKTLQIYHLFCHQLQVGDVCLTLSPIIQSAIKKQNLNRNENIQRKPNGHTYLSNTIESKLPAKKFDLRINYSDKEEIRNSIKNVNDYSNGNADNITGGSVNGNFHLNIINHQEEMKKSENDNNNNSNNTSDKYDGLPNRKKRRWSAPDQITEEYHTSPLASPSSSSISSMVVSAKNM